MASQLRISGGKHKNKRLSIATTSVTRPAQSIVRACLFSWINHDVSGKYCLDLFAGTGILSWEMLSRGASGVVLVEQNPVACRNLNRQAREFGYSRGEATILRRDVYRWLLKKHPKEYVHQFDFIFIDPPYETDYFEKCLHLLLQQELLASGGYIFYEVSRKVCQDATWLDQSIKYGPKSYQVIKSSKRGNTYFGLIAEINC